MAASVTDIEKGKKKKEKPARADRKRGFSEKTRYTGKTAKLTLFVREKLAKQEGDPSTFEVFAVMDKAGKKDRGAVSEHKTLADAMKKYDALGEQTVKAGWTLVSRVSKSSFEDIPKAS